MTTPLGGITWGDKEVFHQLRPLEIGLRRIDKAPIILHEDGHNIGVSRDV